MSSKIRNMLLLLALVMLLCIGTSALADTLVPGDKGTQVLELQNQLSELEYYNAKPTSKYDTVTAKSVALFQACNGLASTGKADSETQEMLDSDNAVSYSEYIQREADAQCKPGQKGSYVKAVQKRLKTYGYFNGPVNGNYGVKTEAAVNMFQEANGLDATGVADRATRTKLEGKGVVSYKTYIANNNLTTLTSSTKNKTQILYYQQQLVNLGYLTKTTGKFDKATITATKYLQLANGLTATSKADFATRSLVNKGTSVVTYAEYAETMRATPSKINNQGLNVYLLQQRLNELGYLAKSGITGKFTSATKKAVTTFQSFNNITMTGVADADTLSVLFGGNALTYSQVAGSNTLKKGMSSLAVKTMQLRLKKLGLFTGECSGNYGDKTVAAVKAFQKSIGYTESGVAYTTTLAKLKEQVPDSEIASNAPNEKIEKVIAIAESKLGYKYGHGYGPTIFDCCGFVRYCYSKGAGITLPWSVKGQATYAKGEVIDDLSDCKRGDILIFENDKTGSSYSKYSHAVLYLGNGVIIHASSSQGKVVETNIKSGYSANYYQKHFVVGVRILE